MENFTLSTIKEAQKKIDHFIRKTPLIHSEFLSELCNGDIYLKLENQQVTNAFKIRGALNKLSQLTREEKLRGIVTASSGNHAQGAALAANNLGIKIKILVPENISRAKLEKIKKYDAEIIQGGEFDEVETRARELSIQEGLTYISPYNDFGIVAGQGTIGLEIYEKLKHVESVIVPIGGGSLISGIGFALKSLIPNIEIIGVQTEGASTMYASWKAGKVNLIEEHDTLADGLLGGLDPNPITLDLILKFVDHIELVEEESIKEAIHILWKEEGQVVEGAGATPVAYLIEHKQDFPNKNVVAVISGGNIEESLFQKIIREK
jgi:threonine dehydratase